VRDTLTLPERARRWLMRTRLGLCAPEPARRAAHGVSAGGNIGERLMGQGARHYGDIRAAAQDWLGRVEIDAAAWTTARAPFREGCSSGCRSRAAW
jgi:putative phosphonate transport system ATP-binding protein